MVPHLSGWSQHYVAKFPFLNLTFKQLQLKSYNYLSYILSDKLSIRRVSFGINEGCYVRIFNERFISMKATNIKFMNCAIVCIRVMLAMHKVVDRFVAEKRARCL